MPINVWKYWNSLSKEMQDYISDLCTEIVKLNYEVNDQKHHAVGLQNRLDAAVDMAARAENERDALVKENSRLHGWLQEAWQKKPSEWKQLRLCFPQSKGYYLTFSKYSRTHRLWWDGFKFESNGSDVSHWMDLPPSPEPITE